MNFPGLDFTWHGGHEGLRRAGAIRPWQLDQCRHALTEGAGVLVVATTALGDALLTTPLLETLAARLGPERVTLLVRKPYAGLFQGDPRVGRVVTVRGKYRWAGLEELALGQQRPTMALLANPTEPDLVPRLWWSGLRGFLRYRSRSTRYPGWMANGAMLRKPGDADYASGHAIENNLAMAEALGLPPSTHRLALPQWHAVAPSVRARRLLLHPGASRARKRWPLEHWAEVGSTLAREFGLPLAITGDRSEVALAEALAHRLNCPTENLAGRLNLVELAQAQAGAALFLSGDTGPYHLAVAVGCPTVTLFAPTDRGSSLEACGPHQADPARHLALQTGAYGDPISSLAPEQVLAAARSLF